MENLYEKTRKMISQAAKILIVSHRQPDADTLGSALALGIWLKKIRKPYTLACIDKPSEKLNFLPYLSEFKQEFDLLEYDLILIVDTGSKYMTNFHLKYENFFDPDASIINIDHHASNEGYGDVNIIDPNVASTTVLLYKMFNHLEIPIDENIATCLLAGIYGDTGSFMHSNTNAEVYEIAADLMDKGAQITDVGKKLFRTNDIPTLRLWGTVMERAHVTDDNVVMSVVREDDYDFVKSDPEQLSGVVEYLNMVPNIKFSVLLNEDRKGNVKGSFRTKNDNVDVSRIAGVFGGGGHPKASGFSVPGRLKRSFNYTIVSKEGEKKSLDF